jgi:transposase InsO family protein
LTAACQACTFAVQSKRRQTLFRAHRGRYGSPRLQRALRAAGWRVSRRRVTRLMPVADLRARVVRVYRANPRLHHFFDQHPNRLPATGAQRPDQVWVGDVTYLPVAAAGASSRWSSISARGACWPGRSGGGAIRA